MPQQRLVGGQGTRAALQPLRHTPPTPFLSAFSCMLPRHPRCMGHSHQQMASRFPDACKPPSGAFTLQHPTENSSAGRIPVRIPTPHAHGIKSRHAPRIRGPIRFCPAGHAQRCRRANPRRGRDNPISPALRKRQMRPPQGGASGARRPARALPTRQIRLL